MLLDLIDVISMIAIFQLIFTAFFLLTHRRGKRTGSLLLGSFFLALALNLGEGYLAITGFFSRYPAFAFIGNNTGLLFGPLLYFYTLSVVYKDYRLPGTFVLHTIPFLLSLGLSLYFYHLQPSELQRTILSGREDLQFPVLVYIISVMGYLQLFTYLLLAFREIGRYRKTIRQRYSSLEALNLQWLSFTLYAFTAIMLMGVVSSFLTLTANRHWYILSLLLIISLTFLFINQVIFRVMRQPALFAGLEDPPPQPARYASSSLSREERLTYLQQLQSYMQQEKPYLDASLSLEQLAQALEISPKYLSQVINESLQQSFFDFVNGYRLEEAKHLLKHAADPRTTILEVMYASGFNSKSSFNTFFKKKTGFTPSEYKRKHTGRAV